MLHFIRAYKKQQKNSSHRDMRLEGRKDIQEALLDRKEDIDKKNREREEYETYFANAEKFERDNFHICNMWCYIDGACLEE